MPKQKITLKELAKIVGVSPSTVSKALNDSFEISEDTKKRVREAALKFNYSPNLMAQGLKTSRTGIIGVIIPDMRAPFFIRVLRGIEKEASKQGYQIITCFSNESFKKEKEILDMLSSGRVDGIIMSLSKKTQELDEYKHLQEIQEKELPIALFDRVDDRINCDKVVINDFDSTFRATNHLLNSGSSNILFISQISNTSVGKDRFNGYLEALQNANGPQARILEVEEYKSFEKELIKVLNTKKIDAILTANELAAITAINIVTKLGLSIPNDVSVIGFTNGLLSMNSNPPLTTISQHGKKMGKLATQNIINRIKFRKGDFKTTVIETTLIKRGSTRN